TAEHSVTEDSVTTGAIGVDGRPDREPDEAVPLPRPPRRKKAAKRPELSTASHEYLPLSAIRVDGDTQVRVRTSDEKVREYAEILREAWDNAVRLAENDDVLKHFQFPFPPVVVFYDNR